MVKAAAPHDIALMALPLTWLHSGIQRSYVSIRPWCTLVFAVMRGHVPVAKVSAQHFCERTVVRGYTNYKGGRKRNTMRSTVARYIRRLRLYSFHSPCP